MKIKLSKDRLRFFSKIQRQYMGILLISVILYILCTSVFPVMTAIALKSRFIIFPAIIICTYCQHMQKVRIDYASIFLFGLGAIVSAVFSNHVMNVVIKTLTIILMFFVCSAYFSLNRINTIKSFFWIMKKVSYFILIFNLLYLIIGRGMFYGVFRGFFTNRNACGAAIVITFLVLLGSFIQERRTIDLFFLMLNTYFIFLTESRGTFIGVLIGIGIFLFFVSKNKKSFIGKIICILILIFVFWDTISNIPIVSRILEEGLQRDELWEYAFENIRLHPWVGVGFSSSSLENQLGAYSGMNYHNSYIAMLADVGIIGVTFFIIMFIKIGRKIYSNYSNISLENKIQFVTLLSICIAFLGLSFGEAYLLVAGSPFSFIFWCCLYSLYYAEEEEL